MSAVCGLEAMFRDTYRKDLDFNEIESKHVADNHAHKSRSSVEENVECHGQILTV